MLFEASPASWASRPALVEQGNVVTYGELEERIAETSSHLPGEGQLVVVLVESTTATVVHYMACLRHGNPVLLLDPQSPPGRLSALVDLYAPAQVWAASRPLLPGARELPGVMGSVWTAPTTPSQAHPDLALLLSTSGTTGAAKAVRLARSNVVANARSIAAYLEINATERALLHLPLHYSYGLSVLNSHLEAGASVLLTNMGLIEPAFWKEAAAHECTSLAGVPFTFDLLRRVGFPKMRPATLRTLTQAGGRMEPSMVDMAAGWMEACDGRLWVMYGQTEATARMAYVPPADLARKRGSAGRAIPGGRFRIQDDRGRDMPAGEVGEVIYEGPNVMMGYAESAADLARGDELRGSLRTGDLGRLDADGFLFLTGRLKRFVKPFGLRIALDELEAFVAAGGPVAATGTDRLITLHVEAGRVDADDLPDTLAQRYKLPRTLFEIRFVASLPRTSNGKVDYQALEAAHVVPRGH